MRILGGSFVVACALVPPATAGPPPAPIAVPVLEVHDPTGGVTQATARDAVLAVEPELAKCAADAKWKGDALAWIITDWHGKVTKLELAVDKPAVEKCFARSLRTIVIAKAQSRATVMLRLQVGPTRPAR